MKILIETVNGQSIREISPGDVFQTSAQVIWDESIDGEFPIAILDKVGWLSKVDGALAEDPIKKAAYDQAVTEAQAKEKARADRKARLKNVNAANTLPEIRSLLKDICDEIGI
jgi:hypothetical protein